GERSDDQFLAVAPLLGSGSYPWLGLCGLLLDRPCKDTLRGRCSLLCRAFLPDDHTDLPFVQAVPGVRVRPAAFPVGVRPAGAAEESTTAPVGASETASVSCAQADCSG